LKAIHNAFWLHYYSHLAVAKVFKEQIESNSQHRTLAVQITEGCGKGIQRTN